MTQPPSQPPQGGFGAPQDPDPRQSPGGGQPGPAAPQGPPQGAPGFGPPPEQPGPGQPGSGHGHPQAPPPPGRPPQAPPPPGRPPQAPPGTPPPGQPPSPPPGQPGAGGQPGYGFPGAPGPGQPPTVAPQQYGYPAGQGYPGQGPYGAPTPYPPGPPYQGATVAQPAASGGRGRNTQMTIIVAAVVAVALIVGGGIWYASSGSDDTKDQASSSSGGSSGGDGKNGGGGGGGGKEKAPSNTSARVLMQVPAPEVGKNDTMKVEGSWLHGSVYAKSGVAQVVGYDTATGKQSWTVPLDGQVCAGSPEVTDAGVAAVVYEEGKPKNTNDFKHCDKLAAIDLTSGKKLWSKEVKLGDTKPDYDEVSISGDIVAVGGGTDGGAAFDLATGKAKWTPQPGDQCHDVGYRGGEQLVAVRTCGEYDNPKISVQVLDQSGKPTWSYKLPDGVDNAKVISSKPVVFGVDSGDITATGVTDVFAMDDAGKLRSKITLADGKYNHRCEVNEVHSCYGIAVGNDKLYVPTAEHQGSGDTYGTTNEIVSFDLATGKPTGDRADAGERYKIFPLRMDGSNVLAYKDGPYDKGAQVVSIDSGTMKETKLLETPASRNVLDVLSSMVPDRAEVLYGDGKLFIAKQLIGSAITEDQKMYQAIGFSD